MKNRPVYGRILVDYAPMQDLLIDIKTVPQAFGGYHLLLLITCDQTNFTIAVPLRDRQTQTVAEALTLPSLTRLAPLKSLVTLYINICKITFFPSTQYAYIYAIIFICKLC